MKHIALILVAFCLTQITGCGFHLPNQTRLSETFSSINVSGDYHHPFYKKVVQDLKLSGVKVNAQFSKDGIKEDKSVPTLLIPEPKVSMPIASIDANAEVLEYQLIVSSATTLRIPNHRPILMRNSLTRNLLNKPGMSLQSDTERALVTDETYDELASELVTRLSYLGRQSDPDAQKTSPAELTLSDGESNQNIKKQTLSDDYANMTLLEALQLSASEEQENGQKENLSDLNNGNAILKHSYSLPKVAPVPKSEIPYDLDPKSYDINEQK